MNTRTQIFISTFLCYTSIHALRTSYSYAKRDIEFVIDVNQTYLGVVDALMLAFLGIGHFIHTVHPIRKPVRTLWAAMILCGMNYLMIPVCMNIPGLKNFITLALFMCINGFLQSYTWPNLLMLIHSKFDPEKYAVLLGFWSTNANVGNILGYGIFQIMIKFGYYSWALGLTFCAFYAIGNGGYVWRRIYQLEVQQENKSYIQLYNQMKAPQMSKKISGTYTPIQAQQQNKGKNQKNPSKLSQQIPSPENSPKEQQTRQLPSIRNVAKDPNIVLLTLTFALVKSVIYGIMLWLPLYFKLSEDLNAYAAQIPIVYDVAAILGSIMLGYGFNKVQNKGLLMIPFIFVVFVCFFMLKFAEGGPALHFFMIGLVGFALGGIFNTLASLVVMELITIVPECYRRQSLGFYSALTMAIGNITTALTQILIGFVIGQQDHESIFVVFMIYSAVCLIFLILLAAFSNRKANKQKRQKSQVSNNNKDHINFAVEENCKQKKSKQIL